MDPNTLTAVHRYIEMVEHALLNNKSYDIATKMHDEYISVRKKLIADKCGLIEPIRAIVKTAQKSDFGSSELPDAFIALKSAFYDLGRIGTSFSFVDGANILTDSRVADYNEYLRRTAIVGYMVAMKVPTEKSQYRVGMSLCSPKDFKNFNKEVGLLLAYEDLHLERSNPAPWDHAVRATDDVILAQDSSVFYVFPMNLVTLRTRFLRRADSYFRVDNKGEKA